MGVSGPKSHDFGYDDDKSKTTARLLQAAGLLRQLTFAANSG